MKLTRELVRRFETHLCEHFESLMRASMAEPGNDQEYAFFRDGTLRAHVSGHPHAGWATCAYHVNQQPPEKVHAMLAFFKERNVPAKVRIVPDGFNPNQADLLSAAGLRHIGFHTVLWSTLPLPRKTSSAVDIREATTPDQIESHITLQLVPYSTPAAAIEQMRPLRRRWWFNPRLKFYIAYIDGVPAGQAILDVDGEIGLLASASTLPEYCRQGLQSALIQRRIADAEKLGCKIILGAADFENNSRTNQMAAGLQVAYTAAWWIERGGKLA